MRQNWNTVSPTTLVEATVLERAESPEQRIVAAALRCFARWGVEKTTLEDVARDAGYSRATVYRCFPGGKDAVVQNVARTEVGRFLSGVAKRLDEVAGDGLEAVLVAGMTEAGRRFRDHPALQYLLRHEPETVLPRLCFAHMDELLATASTFAHPWLTPYLDEETALRVAEWATRILLSYASCPADDIDIGEETSVRFLVKMFVLPGTVPQGDLSDVH